MNRPSIVSVLAVLVPLALTAGCGGAKSPAKEAAPAVAETPNVVCVRAFERQRECTAVFIPALVAARVEVDLPPGIAATDASEGRAVLVAKANDEWKVDSTDEAIARTCAALSIKIPPDRIGPMTDTVKGCLAAADCDGFTTCLIPFLRAQWQQGGP